MKTRGILCILFLFLGGLFQFLLTTEADTSADAGVEAADAEHPAPGEVVLGILQEYGISRSYINTRTAERPGASTIRVIQVQVANDLPLARVNNSITAALRDAHCEIFSGLESADGLRLTIRAGIDGAVTDSLILRAGSRYAHTRGRIALVIDDLEADTRLLREFLRLPDKLTMAVIPGWPGTTEAARLAAEAGKEIIVHLPMETETPPGREEPLRLKTGMNAATVRKYVIQALDQVPKAMGLNNHEGSKGTADKTLMGHLARALRGRNLYFLDSATSQGSVAFETLRKARIPALRRDVFLDHEGPETTPEAFEAQILQRIEDLCAVAAKKQAAVAIAHVHKEASLRVLQRALPLLYRRGFDLVFVSELL